MKFNNQDRQCVVTLSAAKGLSMGSEMLPLRCAQGFGSLAQHDNAGFGR